MSWRRWWVAAASAALLIAPILTVETVWAQPAAPVPASDYDALIREALAEFKAHDFAEARALFERAHALSPSARTLRGLGITAFELKRYAHALSELEAALADARKPLTEEQRSEVQALIAKTQRFVGKIKLELAPRTATVSIDGQPAASSTLVLDLGEHELSVQAAGYREKQWKLVVDGGEDTTQRIELTRLELSPALATTPGASAVGATRDGSGATHATHDTILKRWWFWTAVGVVVVGAAVGTALALGTSKKTRVEALTTSNTPKGAMLLAAWGP